MQYLERLKSKIQMSKQTTGKRGKRVMLDLQHKHGQFDFLYSIEEIGHYMIIIGYLPYIHRNPTILDVGCGQGRLFQLLDATSNYRSYLGIDFSQNAIKKAKHLANHKSTFELTDFEVWKPANRYDVIIFSESIYYIDYPRDILHQYATYLSSDGAMIVSIYRHFGNERIWDDLDREFHFIAGSQIKNLGGHTWDVKVLRPKMNIGSS